MSAETPEKFGLDQALLTLETFASAGGLTGRIADLEQAFASKPRSDIVTLLQHEAIDETVLAAALAVKRVAGEINVIVHAVGVLTALPYVLEEGERVESLSLGELVRLPARLSRRSCPGHGVRVCSPVFGAQPSCRYAQPRRMSSSRVHVRSQTSAMTANRPVPDTATTKGLPLTTWGGPG